MTNIKEKGEWDLLIEKLEEMQNQHKLIFEKTATDITFRRIGYSCVSITIHKFKTYDFDMWDFRLESDNLFIVFDCNSIRASYRDDIKNLEVKIEYNEECKGLLITTKHEYALLLIEKILNIRDEYNLYTYLVKLYL